MLLEICANSYQSAINAQKANADRIELCSALSVGGLTPSYGLLHQISKEITIPVHVLIRPRSGNFCYTDNEFQQMKSDITLCKKLGFKGIVSGILNKNNTLDIERTKELVELSKPLSLTFHRAFDCVQNPEETLLQLIDLGIDRVLTSGLKNKAIDGIETLKSLNNIANGKIGILPGSGINTDNILAFKKAGFSEVHTSASKVIKSSSVYFDKTMQTISDCETIKQLLKIIKSA
ncbi:MAG: copper homeostasis protein CutC [Flavobacteriaceae bacterium]|nr:copper homeostasis protein CutC [Flavobacteriaceae bacterium]